MEIDFSSYYRPTEKQIQFHKAPHRYKLYGGAMGGGKTFALCAEAIRLAFAFPGNVIYFCRKEYETLKRTSMAAFEEVCPPELIKSWPRSGKVITFINGSQILWGDLENLDKLKSLNIGAAIIDEASEASEEAFHMLDSRLRKKVPGIRYYLLMASNPEWCWLKPRFVDNKFKEHIFIQALPTDNPHLPTDYVDNLRRNFPDDWVKKYLEGSWDCFEGQIWKNFNPDRIVKNIDVNPAFPRVISMDYGFTNPTCIGRAAIDYDGKVILEKTWYKSEATLKEIAEKLEEFSTGVNVDHYIIDPSAAGVAFELSEHGFPFVDANNDVLTGIMRVDTYLRNKMLTILPGNDYFVKECLGYKWDKPGAAWKKDDPQRPLKKDDHGPDMIRYMLMDLPEPATIPKKKNPFMTKKNGKVVKFDPISYAAYEGFKKAVRPNEDTWYPNV